jgi:integrase/recombinase XerD
VKRVKSWAGENHLSYLDEITPPLLYAWRGQWSEDAPLLRDRLGPASQNLYVGILHRFFRWALLVDYVQKDPSVILRSRKFERSQTHPLSSDAQFEEILRATYRVDDERQCDVPEYGRDLRAIFLLQRWTGVRIIDALTLPHNAIRRCPLTGRTLMTLTTKKNHKLIKDRPLPVAVTEALAAIPRQQEHVRPGYYFWYPNIQLENLTNTWAKRIRENLNPLLSLDEESQPMAFHSHMLRDTFAVELLLKGVGIEEVSKLLTHHSIQMTEKYYSPWVKKRREKLHDTMVEAMERMGAIFTPASAPLPTAPQRLM